MRSRGFYLSAVLCAAKALPAFGSGCIVYEQAGAAQTQYTVPYSADSAALVQAAKPEERDNVAARARRFQCLDSGELGSRQEAGRDYIPVQGTSGCYETVDACADARSKNSDPVYKAASAILDRTLAYEKNVDKTDAQKLAQVSRTERDSVLMSDLMILKQKENEDPARAKELEALWDEMEDRKGALRVDEEGTVSRIKINDQVAKYRQSIGVGD